MSDYKPDEFSFLALNGKTTLAYLIGLVDSDKHKASDPHIACYQILYRMAGAEEQIQDADGLLGAQAQFLPENYLPQTPVMFVKKWSPIYSLLEKEIQPLTLARLDVGPFVVATGIWKPESEITSKSIEECQSDEELFWAVLREAFKRAKERGLLINLITQPGWKYENSITFLPKFDENEIIKSGRILWKRAWKI